MNTLEKLIYTYKKIIPSDIKGFNEFNQFLINYHSTKIEGLSLSELESEILLNNKLTPKGRPLSDLYMITDHAAALTYVIEQANKKEEISINLIQKINAKVLKNTGVIIQMPHSSFDTSEGILRKWGVNNGRGDSYPDHHKIESRINKIVQQTTKKMKNNLSVLEITNLAFEIHYELVALHPFGDGNGRTSRLMMNYLQIYYNLPMTIINSKDTEEYIFSLRKTDKTGNKKFFNEFLHKQYKSYLLKIINKHISNTKEDNFKFLF